MTVSRQTHRTGDWALAALAFLILLTGLIFTGGGAYLLSLGGSPYYIICGLVLLLSGVFLARKRLMGAYLFLIAWTATFFWTWYESGAEPWGWVPRFFGPTLIAGLVIWSLPALRRRDTLKPATRKVI